MIKNIYKLFCAAAALSYCPFVGFSQNVGIGTTTPTLARIQIQGAVGGNLLMARTNATSAGLTLANVGNYPTLGFNTEISGGYKRMYHGQASFFQFDVASGDNKYWLSSDSAADATAIGGYYQPFTLQGSGNVRINNYLGINANGNVDSGRVIIAHNSSIASPTLKLLETSNTDYARFELSNTGTNRFWHIAGFNSTSGTAFDRLNFYHSTAGDIMSITGDGRVGFGTTSPATGYKVSVNGKVICTELRVQTVGSWPDYVFANNYQLRSLPDLETYIQTNSHLPGIPPAAEVEANGITVGDMQKKLVEKVEELTLYIIQQDKTMKALEMRLRHLENSTGSLPKINYN